LFYFIKQRRLGDIIDSKIGLGDVVLLPAIGITLDALSLIVFFALGFAWCALAGVFFAKKRKTIPLAGLMVCWHFVFFLMEDKVEEFLL
jgi:hypothetical protein